MAKTSLCDPVDRKLIDFLMKFPFVYMDILREQIAACEITHEKYPDCYIIHFHHKKDTAKFPLWLPTMPQSCQILKPTGPLTCQLYIELGYIVQFEVVDMGMNEIDWDYLWSYDPVFDMEYDLSTIRNHLMEMPLCISKLRISQQYVYINVTTPTKEFTISLWNPNILLLNLPFKQHSCRINISTIPGDNQRYLIQTDDDSLAIECSLICMQNSLII